MQVFLSWSGNRSKAVAEAFSDWLGKVIQALDPWMSVDIEKGARWSAEIADRLENSHVGIICVTPENLNAPWLLFEAGALSKNTRAHVCTFLLSVAPANVEPPLGQFQHTIFDKDDVFKLVATINQRVARAEEKALQDKDLAEVFSTYWPKLEEKLKAIQTAGSPPAQAVRPEREILEEMLEIVRRLDGHSKPHDLGFCPSGPLTAAAIASRGTGGLLGEPAGKPDHVDNALRKYIQREGYESELARVMQDSLKATK